MVLYLGVAKTYDESGGGENATVLRVSGISEEIVRFKKIGRNVTNTDNESPAKCDLSRLSGEDCAVEDRIKFNDFLTAVC